MSKLLDIFLPWLSLKRLKQRHCILQSNYTDLRKAFEQFQQTCSSLQNVTYTQSDIKRFTLVRVVPHLESNNDLTFVVNQCIEEFCASLKDQITVVISEPDMQGNVRISLNVAFANHPAS